MWGKHLPKIKNKAGLFLEKLKAMAVYHAEMHVLQTEWKILYFKEICRNLGKCEE